MQHRSSEHQAMHQRRVDTGEGNQVRVSTFELMPQRLTDAPPYSNSYGFEARRPEAPKKAKVVDYEYTAEYARDGYDKVCEEDVNAEADDFIKYEHKKFQMSKLMSRNFG